MTCTCSCALSCCFISVCMRRISARLTMVCLLDGLLCGSFSQKSLAQLPHLTPAAWQRQCRALPQVELYPQLQQGVKRTADEEDALRLAAR